MKKRNVINLIRYHAENNDLAFRNEACEIARDFDRSGDCELAEYVMALVSDANAFVPQSYEGGSEFFRKLEPSSSSLPLPRAISADVTGVCNAIAHDAGVNKFLFQGPPGTGKTETARQIARIVRRDIYAVDFSAVIDSKLGQTAKNIAQLFREINSLAHPERAIFLFDEIDSLALDRVNQHDVREMGRATSTLLRELDSFNEKAVLVATTNLYRALDKALTRRFDAIIDFSRYTREDLIDISEVLLGGLLERFDFAARDMRLFRKIMAQMVDVPYPGELQNMLRAALAFSSPDNPYDYLKRLYVAACPGNPGMELPILRDQGFTVRESEALTGISRSTISRELKEAGNE